MRNNARSLFLLHIFLFSFLLSFSRGKAMIPSSSNVVKDKPLLDFLQRVQHKALTIYGEQGFDPKLYVDLPLKRNLSAAESAFEKLGGSPASSEFKRFITEYFDGAGDDLVDYVPEDFIGEPEGFLPKVEHDEIRAWALEVHALWKRLSARVTAKVGNSTDKHTLLPLPEPVVRPGSRFREIYYWDSYWIIRGLLVSKMYSTAKAIVNDLIYLVETYGFVPNGARAYYTNRSQPPLLSSMVCDIFNRTGDKELVTKALPALLKEHQFWNSEMHSVKISDAEAETHILSRYYAMWNKPRPESSTIDEKLASKLKSAAEKRSFYRELASAAESGWDFSSRWMRNSSDMTTMATTSVVPVDLNVFLLKMELDIAFLAEVCGRNSIVEHFREASRARKRAIDSILWNNEMGQWLDYWLSNKLASKQLQPEEKEAFNQNRNVFASNFFPLWLEPFNSDPKLVGRVTKTLRNSGLLSTAGVATSLENSGQQWDFPNGWSPVQHVIVEGLLHSGLEEARSLAEEIVVRWIRSSYATYKKTGAMHEKLDVQNCGEFGGGGEYVPQTGFGWSNGVVLTFLEEFGWPKQRIIKICA